MSEWLSGCTWECVQERNENEKDRAVENQKVLANVSDRKALSTGSVKPQQLVFGGRFHPWILDMAYYDHLWNHSTEHLKPLGNVLCLSNNSVFITSQLGGDLKREAGALIDRRGRTGVKRQINKQAIILTHTPGYVKMQRHLVNVL